MDVPDEEFSDPPAGEFSVWVFLPDESHYRLAGYVDAEHAVRMARSAAIRATRHYGPEGAAARIIITDDGDYCVFEWRRGEGVTWPPRGVAA